MTASFQTRALPTHSKSNIAVKRILLTRPWRSLAMMLPMTITSLAFAHMEQQPHIKTGVNAAASFTWRSDSVLEKTEPYLIPGALMGGESVHSAKGFNFDEALLGGTLTTAHRFYIDAKITAHTSDELQIENLAIVLPEIKNLGNGTLALGKLNSETTETASWHATSNRFSEASLLSDIFFGRHATDIGIRASGNIGVFRVGAEIFNGDSWPASKGEGSTSLFIQYDVSFANLDLSADFWGTQSHAKNRTDTRYSAGHSHGGTVISSPSTEYFFSGDIASLGAVLNIAYDIQTLGFYGQAEWISSKSEGDIRNTTQSSEYENQYDGYRLLLGATYGKHEVSAQYEEVVLENALLSPVSGVFAQNANLINNGFEPSKTLLGWRYQLNPELALRVEGVVDKSVSQDAVNKFNVGVIWKGSIL